MVCKQAGGENLYDQEQDPLIKRKVDDDHLEPDRGQLGLPGAVLALLCTCVGGGIVAVPRALSLAGWGVGIPILATSAALNALSLHCLFQVSRAQYKPLSYQELVRKYLPQSFSVIVEASIAVLLLGAIGTTLLLASHVFRSVEYSIGAPLVSQDLISALLLAIALPLCLPRSFAALWWVNIVNFASTLGVVLIICSQCAEILLARTGMRITPSSAVDATPGFMTTTSPGGALAAVPLALYVFFCQIGAPQLYWELRADHKRQASYSGTFAASIGFCLYVAVGSLGFAVFGSQTQGDILMQLSGHNPGNRWLCVGQALFGSVLLLATPLVLTPLRAMVVSRVAGDVGVEHVPFNMHFAITASLLGIAAVVARAIPFVDVLMGVLGATCVAFLALTVPGLLALRCWSSGPCSDNGDGVDAPPRGSLLFGYTLVGSGLLCTPLTLGCLVARHLGFLP